MRPNTAFISHAVGGAVCALDAYLEFRHYTNDGRIKSGDREKGFYGLNGALQYFCEDGIDTAHKIEMRDRLQGHHSAPKRTRR
jgi:hypothetical protein